MSNDRPRRGFHGFWKSQGQARFSVSTVCWVDMSGPRRWAEFGGDRRTRLGRCQGRRRQERANGECMQKKMGGRVHGGVTWMFFLGNQPMTRTAAALTGSRDDHEARLRRKSALTLNSACSVPGLPRTTSSLGQPITQLRAASCNGAGPGVSPTRRKRRSASVSHHETRARLQPAPGRKLGWFS